MAHGSLSKNILWAAVGNVGYTALRFALLVTLARLGGPATVGIYVLGLTIATPILTFSGLSLRNFIATERLDRADFDAPIRLRLRTTLMAAGAIAIVSAFFVSDLFSYAAVLVVGLSKCVEALSDILYGIMQRFERMDLVSKSMAIRGSLSVIAMFVAMEVTQNCILGLLAILGIWLLVLILHDRPRASALLKPEQGNHLTPERYGLLSLALLCVPLGISASLQALSSSIPRLSLETARGTTELGLYGALAYFAVPAGTIVHAAGAASSNRIAQYLHLKSSEYARLLWKLILIALGINSLLLIAYVFMGEYIISLVYGAHFAKEVPLLLLLLLVGVGEELAFILALPLLAARRLKLQLVIGIAGTVAVLVASVLLVPRLGSIGAALSMCASLFIQILMLIAACIIVRSQIRSALQDS